MVERPFILEVKWQHPQLGIWQWRARASYPTLDEAKYNAQPITAVACRITKNNNTVWRNLMAELDEIVHVKKRRERHLAV